MTGYSHALRSGPDRSEPRGVLVPTLSEPLQQTLGRRFETSLPGGLVAKDIEGFVQDRSQFRKDRATANAPALVMLDFRLRDAHPIHCKRTERSDLVCPVALAVAD